MTKFSRNFAYGDFLKIIDERTKTVFHETGTRQVDRLRWQSPALILWPFTEHYLCQWFRKKKPEFTRNVLKELCLYILNISDIPCMVGKMKNLLIFLKVF